MLKSIQHKKEIEAKEYLVQVLNSIFEISEDSMKHLVAVFKFAEYDKNTEMIKNHEITDYVYFISKGIIKAYYHQFDREIIDWFGQEGFFFSNMYNHITQNPSADIYETVEDTNVLIAKYSDLEELYKNSHEIETLARKVMIRSYKEYVERVHYLKALSSEEKYNFFISHYSHIANRIPLKFLANYLGITPETLSRIRANAANVNRNNR